MLLALIIIGSIAGYSSMIGLTYRWFDDHTRMDEEDCFFFGLFWPISLPAGFAWNLSDRPKRVPRDEKRRAKEIAEAEHRKTLARLAAEELAINERSLNIK
jgi:hypothetical protein